MNTAFCLIMIITVGAITLVSAKARSVVRNSLSADESCYYRKIFAITRFCMVFIASVILLFILANLDSVSGLDVGLMSAWGAICLSINFPVYAIRPSHLHNECFVLYLMGFSRDNYGESIETLQKSSASKSFSEGRSIHLLKQYIPVYAVGMTKELEAPHGASRIYLEDAEWEQEVEALMKKATMIIVLLNDSNSCIWEIQHAHRYKNKTVYICDSQEKLINVRHKLNASREGVAIPLGMKVNTITFTDSKGSSRTIPIDHTDKDYSQFIHRIMSNRFGLNRHIFSNREVKKFSTIFGIVLTPVIIVYFMLLDLNPFLGL